MSTMVAHTPTLASAAQRFHALSDETRLAIVHLLSSGERCVCELTSALAAAQSRLSFHLRVLREAGIVTDRKSGRWNYYSLDPDALDEMRAYLGAVEPRKELPIWDSPSPAADGCCL